MDILKQIYSAASQLQSLHAKVKSNTAQSASLNVRVQNLLPQLRKLEARMRGAAAPHADDQVSSFLGELQITVDDAVVLISNLTEASWWQRAWHGDAHGKAFESLNRELTGRMSDLGFEIQVDVQQDAADARLGVAELLRVVAQLDLRVRRADETAAEHAARARREQANLQRQLERRLLQQSAPSVAAGASAAASSVSAATPCASRSPVRNVMNDVLHLNLDDLRTSDAEDAPPMDWSAPVGGGGFGDVFRAWSSSRLEFVAVKKLRVAALDDADLRDFYRELSVMQYLPRHGHIVNLLGVVTDQKTRTYLILLEWMAGGSLYGHLRSLRDEGRALPWPRVLELALQCAKAVNHLHSLRAPHGPVVHRDLKSLNFLLDAHGDIKVCDFGMAHVRLTSSTQSRAPAGSGTLRWSPPEFLLDEGRERATPAADVYSLGVVLWELCTQRLPYGQSTERVIERSIEGGPERKLKLPDSVPQGMHRLLHACWQNKPENRPTCLHIIHAIMQMQREDAAARLSGSAASVVSADAVAASAGSVADEQARRVVESGVGAVEVSSAAAAVEVGAGANDPAAGGPVLEAPRDEAWWIALIAQLEANNGSVTEVKVQSDKHCLTAAEVQRLCAAISNNTHVTALSLSEQPLAISSNSYGSALMRWVQWKPPLAGEATRAALGTMLQRNRSIKHLQLDRCGLGDEGVVCLAEALRSLQLETLDIRDNGIGERGMRALLTRLVQCKLHCLDVSKCAAVGACAAELCDVLQACPLLERYGSRDLRWNWFTHPMYTGNLPLHELRAIGCGLDDCSLALLAPHCRYLTTLNLGLNRGVTAAGWRAWLREMPDNDYLSALSVERNELIGECMPDVCALLQRCRSLRTLDLGACGLGDSAAETLAAALGTDAVRLHFLHLQSNRIGRMGGEALAGALRTNTHMRMLGLSENEDVPADLLADIAASLQRNAAPAASSFQLRAALAPKPS